MEKRFNISQGMICGSAEAEKRTYKLLKGKSGKKWLIACQANEADNIYVEGEKDSDGFGGRVLNFLLKNGKTISLKGPWHSNSDSLFNDTGYDVRNKCFTQGIIALKIKESDYYKGTLYSDILFEDQKATLGKYNRIENKAQEFANKLNKKIHYAVISKGGGSSCTVESDLKEKK